MDQDVVLKTIDNLRGYISGDTTVKELNALHGKTRGVIQKNIMMEPAFMSNAIACKANTVSFFERLILAHTCMQR
jgi:hypothetical protein